MRILGFLSVIVFIVSCSPKADIDAYVKKSCECITKITADKNEKSVVAQAIYGCADYANNQEIHQELITRYMDENPEASYVGVEQQTPLVIETKLRESCPAYSEFTGD